MISREQLFTPAWLPEGTTFVTCLFCGSAVENTAEATDAHLAFHNKERQ